jgi:hypothetical protein
MSRRVNLLSILITFLCAKRIRGRPLVLGFEIFCGGQPFEPLVLVGEAYC